MSVPSITLPAGRESGQSPADSRDQEAPLLAHGSSSPATLRGPSEHEPCLSGQRQQREHSTCLWSRGALMGPRCAQVGQAEHRGSHSPPVGRRRRHRHTTAADEQVNRPSAASRAFSILTHKSELEMNPGPKHRMSNQKSLQQREGKAAQRWIWR